MRSIPDTPYLVSPSRSRSPLSVRFTSPFLLALNGLSAAATRDDIYHQCLIKSPRAARFDLRPPRSRILFSRCFASSRRSGRAGFPSDKPTSPLFIVLPLKLRRRHDERSLINQVTLPRFCAPSAPRRIKLSFLEVPFTRSFPCPSGFDSRLDFYAYRSLRDPAVQPPGLRSFAASCFRVPCSAVISTIYTQYTIYT